MRQISGNSLSLHHYQYDKDSLLPNVKAHFSLIFLLVLIASSHVGYAQRSEGAFTVAYFAHPEIEPIKQLVQSSYADIGIQIKFEETPIGRGIRMLDAGEVDADLIRVESLADTFPHIRKVPVVLITAKFYLICFKHAKCNTNLLFNSRAVITVSPFDEQRVKQHFGRGRVKAKFYTVFLHETAKELLQKRRVDALLFPSSKGLEVSFPAETYARTLLFKENTVHVVHKQHRSIIPALSDAMKKRLATSALE
ncbi:hypothetical protein OE749_09065 [Aestuariibacter sp. AA17]|uniref:Solute-binding protein family 3/N-terminal domain-containing protein n=1 Tax=Fluctibacter corallii TaxID=2984329 RepID=A0ABT3A8E0_9ALTE|nr:hypothetical protein [Aestuariibacter sp. AA17]MCV2884844.1 hypothetical protein [Aestuariibacter sp. AA17]